MPFFSRAMTTTLAFAGLVDGEASVNAVLTAVRRPNVATEIGTINRDFARDCGVGFFRCERFTQFMREDEGGLVLNVKISAQLKRAVALRAVHEDGDGQKNSLEPAACGWRRSSRE